MSLWPSFRRDIAGFQPTNLNRGGWLNQHAAPTPSRINVFGFLSPTSSWPEGAFPAAPVRNAPLVAGGMDAARTDAEVNASGSVLAGGPVGGDASIDWTLNGGMSLVIGMDGAASLTMTGPDSVLRLTVGIDGTASWVITGNASNLAMIVPLGDAGGTLTLSGVADLRGLLAMDGTTGAADELSPEAIARAVLQEHVEGGLAVEEVLRLLLAVASGKSVILGDTVVFRDQADTKDRIVATVSNGARSTVTVDPT